MSIFDSLQDLVGGITDPQSALDDALGGVSDMAAEPLQTAQDMADPLIEQAGAVTDEATQAAEDLTSNLGL